ncbi:MAG: hypothetical protein M0036_01280 [Desulfobacteraceae bacterium]|nr:hypothetical protein [Desulfobacteraceae bacterium]
MQIEIPEALADRIRSYCEKNDTEPKEFVFDAIIEKLEQVHKERRKKPRI